MNLSRKLLLAEAALIALPLTVLLFFGTCILGLPLVGILVHLWAEARWRRSRGIRL